MKDASARRLGELRDRMAGAGIDLAILTEPDSIYYLAHLWGYLGVENNRPMLLVVPRAGDAVLIAPAIELAMARRMTHVADIRTWVDGVDGEWPALLDAVLAAERPRQIGVERPRMPGLVSAPIAAALPTAVLTDLSPILAAMRTIKDAAEIEAFREGGRGRRRPRRARIRAHPRRHGGGHPQGG